MGASDEELRQMHWRDRWDYEAERERKALAALEESELVGRVLSGRLGLYYQLWHALGDRGTIRGAALTLWAFLRDQPGEAMMLHRYHCAAALFRILDRPDPDCKDPLRRAVQWDHDGELARQAALDELRALIEERLREAGE